MDSIDDSKSSSKTSKKWSLFQKGLLSKAEIFSSPQLCVDPVELQRVSFATSIDNLPKRPSSFQQVLNQIKANAISTPRSVFRMTKLQNLRKLSKENRSASPQERNLGATTSSLSGVPDALLHVQTRQRSSSNSSISANPADISFTSEAKEPDLIPLTTNNETTLSYEGSTKSNGPPIHVSVSSSIPAGLLLTDSAPLIATSVPELSSASQLDTPDALMIEIQRSKQTTENIRQKILKISEALKAEQALRDENVTEYLRLTKDADKSQVPRVKSVFEKKDQKSKATIAQLQKKLDIYHRKLKEVDGGVAKQGIFRDVGANLRDFSGGVMDSVKHATQNAAGVIASKPKFMANKIKNRFGSADNLVSLKDDYDENPDFLYPGSGDDVSSTSGSIDNMNSFGSDPFASDDNYLQRRIENHKRQESKPENLHQFQSITNQFDDIKNELNKVRQLQADFKKELLKNKEDLQLFVTSQLEVERLRHEEQLNDVNEYHRREITFMKQELSSLEEKMEYHAHERARDIQEALESCQTRISKMELQQQQHSMSVEGLENATARALFGKLMNLLLSVMAVLLVLVSTISGIIMPFIKSQGRVFFTFLAIIISIVTYRNWDTLISWYELTVS